MSSEKLTAAQLDWSEAQVPKSQQFDDVYFSRDDGVQEVRYVFMQHNGLPQRFEQAGSFRIAETGFGTGLNFLVAADAWLQATSAGVLHFISFEKYPLALADLQRAHQHYTPFQSLCEALQKHYPDLLPGWHDLWLANGRIRLTLWFGDVLAGLPELDDSACALIDAWFLDGFAPAKNPQMWQPALFQQMARLSHEQTTFATFTAAGEVRRGLEKAGFAVKKARGHGRKREMCHGELAQKRPFSSKAPWFVRPSAAPEGEVVVIGAGLAGASVAYALARAGRKVRVLEAETEAAQHASGNWAGAVHPLVTADWNLRSQWYLLGFEATLRTLLPWIEQGEIAGDLNGLLQLAVNEIGRQRVLEALERVGLPEDFAVWLSAQEAADKVGGEVSSDGLFFPRGGWVNPPSVVKRCLQHPHISVNYGQAVSGLQAISSGWRITTPNAQFEAACVVVASGALDERLNALLQLPIRPVKGQVTHLESSMQHWPLRCTVTHEGYSAPCGNARAVTGATFEAPDMTTDLSVQGHAANLQQAASAMPTWLSTTPEQVDGRIAFRPTTPDHLPIVGAVADPEWMQGAYLSQSHTHALYRYAPQRYQPGLFVSNGHGPRGLMSVFLAADLLVAEILGETLPMPLSLYRATHPARFAIRQWRSGKAL
ncbi:bifunctional tRNA (5-methylaminomethyl-2-thiouridine)(34)-methyltransferase MnmD/FAD-dependent 5-carboxymethylaminomethyl-2-thiouridine(34) oxidoreductase MnmC [Thiomicrorhabdus cannonii]|uniref:bifunctional tRNA (5-methylaminomethyl-2-thiouridine)(34)-methyltransferase MnmD/FAD-dependent 5-carboxymethylaminomethyl-2-thiouridine(34) oxidoreductase MnmC n=1 Tax=Thiomicrorhabdus cannonii TaxID=2748011 RepID=UPI0015C052B1|nr:bifunctional tRNA (5-methylaminomethyl-2-thiouridine)(34)-methyltransferase MnmD/FAD-dependent 5-carboxymethylaminomethyl-2-thiouridine(34) oxidoreductase MnmC [Thiomicrorhabdus cannonii]